MAKLTGILGTCAIVFAIIDLIHGPHNGDAHRIVIHRMEFVSFFGFLCLLEFSALKSIVKRYNLNRWLAITCLSLLTCILSLIIFGLSGGSLHGDGGPIASSFLLLLAIGSVVLPVSFVAFVVVAISRKRDGV